MEVEQFLTHLAVKRKVAKDTQRQALNALVFLYRTVLGRELGKVMPVRGRHGKRLPVVLTRKEVPGVLQRVAGGCGMHKLMAELMYGSGVRVKECCRLRVKDVDLERLQLAVRRRQGRPGPGDRSPAPAGGPVAGTDRACPAAARGRLGARVRPGVVAAGTAAEIPQRGAGIGMAVLVSVEPSERRSAGAGGEDSAASSRARGFATEGDSGGRKAVRVDEAGHTASPEGVGQTGASAGPRPWAGTPTSARGVTFWARGHDKKWGNQREPCTLRGASSRVAGRRTSCPRGSPNRVASAGLAVGIGRPTSAAAARSRIWRKRSPQRSPRR